VRGIEPGADLAHREIDGRVGVFAAVRKARVGEQYDVFGGVFALCEGGGEFGDRAAALLFHDGGSAPPEKDRALLFTKFNVCEHDAS
jgi:hypothetical protein